MASDKINEHGSGAEIFETLLDAAVLLKLVAQGEKDIQKGRYLSQEEAFIRVRARIQKK